MNSKKILNFQIFSIISTIVLGTFLHFTYELSGNNSVIAFFSAINESVWEHLKLVFFPMLITILISCFYLGKDAKNYICAKTLGIITAILFITIFFYTYTGILGYSLLFLDIGSFIFTVILSEYVTYVKLHSNTTCNLKISILILLILLICFIFSTYFPPKINYFKDPITNTYGISKSF